MVNRTLRPLCLHKELNPESKFSRLESLLKPRHLSRSNIAVATVLIFAANLLFVLPYLASFDLIGDDAAGIIGSAIVSEDWGLHLFHTAYGPNVIRPLQAIGMYWEDRVGSHSVLFSHVITFGWMAIAQTISCVLLTPFIGLFGAVLALLLTSCSIYAAEPLYWLSDRHDIYLYLFSVLTLLFGIKFTRTEKTWPILAATLALWGAFFSNEKATALPLLLAVWVILLKLIQPQLRSRRVLIMVSVSILNLGLYLLLRFLVIGQVIGGYNNTIIPSKVALTTLLLRWSETLLLLPFRQISIEQGQFFAVLAVPCMVAALLNAGLSKRGNLLVALGFVISIFIACVPTLQYALGGFEAGAKSVRLFWLPHLVSAVALAALFSSALRNCSGIWRGVVLFAAFIFTLGIAWGGRGAASAYASAYNYSNLALQRFSEHCSCADTNQLQSSGLPPFPFGVTAFTEDIWIQNNAIYKGFPRCSAAASVQGELCRVRFEDAINEPLLIPVRQSRSRLTALLPNAQFSLAAWGSDNYPTPRFEITLASISSPSENKQLKELWLRGWAREINSKAPPSRFVLYLNDRAVAAIEPNIYRRDLSKPGIKDDHNRTKFGFAFSTELPSDLASEDRITLLAFSLGEREPRHAVLFSRSVGAP